jgi:hypothetical protein
VMMTVREIKLEMMTTAIMIMYHTVEDDDTLQGEGADGGHLPLVHEHGPGAQQHLRDFRVHRLAGGPQAPLWPRPHRASRGGHKLTKNGCRRSTYAFIPWCLKFLIIVDNKKAFALNRWR